MWLGWMVGLEGISRLVSGSGSRVWFGCVCRLRLASEWIGLLFSGSRLDPVSLLFSGLVLLPSSSELNGASSSNWHGGSSSTFSSESLRWSTSIGSKLSLSGEEANI